MDREQWLNKGDQLKEELLEYNWQYRAKICTKCPLAEQKRRDCFKVNNYRMIKGMRIQETHCNWLTKARTAKFRNRIMSFIGIGMHTTFGTPLNQNHNKQSDDSP